VNLKNFAAEVSGGNVYKGAVPYAGTSWLSYHSFSGLSWFKIKGQRKRENSAAVCITLCVTRALENGQIPGDASRVVTPYHKSTQVITERSHNPVRVATYCQIIVCQGLTPAFAALEQWFSSCGGEPFLLGNLRSIR
jgi:hypothetical protein